MLYPPKDGHHPGTNRSRRALTTHVRAMNFAKPRATPRVIQCMCKSLYVHCRWWLIEMRSVPLKNRYQVVDALLLTTSWRHCKTRIDRELASCNVHAWTAWCRVVSIRGLNLGLHFDDLPFSDRSCCLLQIFWWKLLVVYASFPLRFLLKKTLLFWQILILGAWLCGFNCNVSIISNPIRQTV